MKLYLISYDLLKPQATEADYKPLTDALRKHGAKPVLRSQWILNSNSSIRAIFDCFWPYRTTEQDRLLVVEVADWCTIQKNLLTPMPTTP